MRPIGEIAAELGLGDPEWEPRGRAVAKLDPAAVLAGRRPAGKIVLVTGITPTSGGVGKTVSCISLGAALRSRGVRAITCLRQPSMGPVFGVKGGGAGGGAATVEPLAEVNLGLTGDLDALTNAHNLLASLLDNHLHHGNALGIDPATIDWPRATDLEERSLREIEIGRGAGNGPMRSSGFVITPASEVTAILGLARDPADLKDRLARISVGRRRSGEFVRAGDLSAEGPMAALLRHALRPNLLQSADGAPVLVHGGPFGNLSYGTTTRSAMTVARAIADLVVVEAGFATDLGAEKFVDLVAPIAEAPPSAAVLVASLPSLHAQSPGRTGPGSLGPGLENLEQHLENLRAFGLDPIVALNRFPNDDPSELSEVEAFCRDRSVRCERSNGFAEGGRGSLAVAEAVVEAAAAGRIARPIYRPEEPLRAKLETVVRRIYGGDGADLSDAAEAQIARGDLPGADRLPVCLAKTPLSLSDDPKKLGRPRGFRVTVRRFVAADGAGYVVPLLGDIRTMPGLPSVPRSDRISVDASGTPTGVV